MRRVSAKQAKKQRFLKAQTVKAQAVGVCKAAGVLPGPCRYPIVLHHLVQRSVRPDLVDDLANLVPVCVGHHQAIHADEPRAREVGLLAHSWEVP